MLLLCIIYYLFDLNCEISDGEQFVAQDPNGVFKFKQADMLVVRVGIPADV